LEQFVLMFTGIVSGRGQIVSIQVLAPQNQASTREHAWGQQLRITTHQGYLDDVAPGDSIAINGACMTVTHFDAQQAWFCVDVSRESLARTTGLDQVGEVNLEKALRANDRLGGHLVSGHVDGIGKVSRFVAVGESWELCIQADADLARFVARKGSITVNGVSLTVNQVQDLPGPGTSISQERCCAFSINLIPHTLTQTTLGQLHQGAFVNLEIDLIARYVERMLSNEQTVSSGLTQSASLLEPVHDLCKK
jgi:riboflavin synthase